MTHMGRCPSPLPAPCHPALIQCVGHGDSEVPQLGAIVQVIVPRPMDPRLLRLWRCAAMATRANSLSGVWVAVRNVWVKEDVAAYVVVTVVVFPPLLPSRHLMVCVLLVESDIQAQQGHGSHQ